MQDYTYGKNYHDSQNEKKHTKNQQKIKRDNGSNFSKAHDFLTILHSATLPDGANQCSSRVRLSLIKTGILYFKEFSCYDCSVDASLQSAFSFLR